MTVRELVEFLRCLCLCDCELAELRVVVCRLSRACPRSCTPGNRKRPKTHQSAVCLLVSKTSWQSPHTRSTVTSHALTHDSHTHTCESRHTLTLAPRTTERLCELRRGGGVRALAVVEWGGERGVRGAARAPRRDAVRCELRRLDLLPLSGCFFLHSSLFVSCLCVGTISGNRVVTCVWRDCRRTGPADRWSTLKPYDWCWSFAERERCGYTSATREIARGLDCNRES